MRLANIHPFPARMASEIVVNRLADLPKSALILDPMAGSGTVLRAASEMGHRCIGFDLDPLAVLMARVWTTPIDTAVIERSAKNIISKAHKSDDATPPWIAHCTETKKYINFWFARKQARQLRRLSMILARQRGPVADALRISLSRIIITKERGASIARDTSHSRPHRVFFDNDYDVYEGFVDSAAKLAGRLRTSELVGSAVVNLGDARSLDKLPARSVHAVITSPPYLNAIDYLRGHRLSLVWLGFSIRHLRAVRSASIGTEISAAAAGLADRQVAWLLKDAGEIESLPNRERGMIGRYAADIYRTMSEIARVLRPKGELVLAVGNSCLKGIIISNAAINVAAAERAGLRLASVVERELPASSRYLPPPVGRSAPLAKRMRTETVLTFTR
jgi:hypothetical protein